MEQHRQTIYELERASILVLADPSQVSPEQRHDAEQIFMKFHRATSPYDLCRTILDTCHTDYVVFQAASVIKLAVVREWPTLDPAQIESLRVYLLEYVVNHPRQVAFVREQCVQAIAVIYKRGCLDRQGQAETIHSQLFSNIAQLIHSGNLDMQIIACSVLTALLNEFSATSSASSIGLPWEFHRDSKIHFEQKDLKLIFTYCLHTLSELSQSSADAGQPSVLLSKFLSITEQILNWDFLSKLPQKFLKSLTSSSSPAASFRPPESWKEVMLNHQILDMIFAIHRMIRGNEDLCNQSVQCLVQLASMNGTIFSKDELQIEYITYFIDSLLKLLSSVELYSHETLGIANIINSLVQFAPLPTFVQIRADCLSSFLAFLSKLTCSFCERSAKSQDGETNYMEAFEMSLDSWRKFLSCANELPVDELKQHAVSILDCYLRNHLSPPAGIRVQMSAADDDDDEQDDDDRDKFSDQLFAIGSFARHVPEYSIPLFTRLLTVRISGFEAQLGQIKQNGATVENRSTLNEINEDLHWLLLIIADTLTDSADGETVMIPVSIMDYCLAAQQQLNGSASVTVQELLSAANITTSDLWNKADPIIKLISSVCLLSMMEQKAVEAGLTECLSPQVGQSLMRLLHRWVESYLAPNEAYYSQISLSLLSSFGQDSACTLWITSFLLDKVLQNLCVWNFEPDLIVDTVNLLTSLVEKQQRCDITMKCETMWKLVEAFSNNRHPFCVLPPSARRLLCRALVFGGSANFTVGQRQSYMQQVFDSLEKKFNDTLARPDLRSLYHRDEIKNEIISSYDSFCGVAEAATPNNGAAVFQFLINKLFTSVDVLDLYHNYEEVLELVLELFGFVSKQVLCYISEVDCVKLYKATVGILQVYVKHNIGKRCIKKEVEEERYSDLMTLMEILSNILSKDFISFCSGADAASDGSVSAADVAVYGLTILIPLLTDELLMFPHLSSRYMNLVSYMTEIHPSHVCQMSDESFNSLMQSVELSLTRCSGDVVKSCLEVVTHISTYMNQHSALHGSVKHLACRQFLNIFFSMLLGDAFDMDLMESFSPALFTLICSHTDHYKSLVNILLEQYSSTPHHARLVDAFNKLTDFPNSFQLNRASRIAFSQKFSEFIVNVRGFLCIR